MACMSSEETIPADTRAAIIDRMEPWEVIDFLGISMDMVLDVFENEIVDNLYELEDLVGIRRGDYDDEYIA